MDSPWVILSMWLIRASPQKWFRKFVRIQGMAGYSLKMLLEPSYQWDWASSSHNGTHRLRSVCWSKWGDFIMQSICPEIWPRDVISWPSRHFRATRICQCARIINGTRVLWLCFARLCSSSKGAGSACNTNACLTNLRWTFNKHCSTVVCRVASKRGEALSVKRECNCMYIFIIIL